MSLGLAYSDWIKVFLAELAARREEPDGLCKEASEAMVFAFPELRLVCGYVDLHDEAVCSHYWCEAPDGRVVDPTEAQFEENGGIAAYHEDAEIRAL